MTKKTYGAVSITEAAKVVGVHRYTIWRRIKELNIPVTTDPLDKRVKLVRRSDLEMLMNIAERIRNGELIESEVKIELSKRKAARS